MSKGYVSLRDYNFFSSYINVHRSARNKTILILVIFIVIALIIGSVFFWLKMGELGLRTAIQADRAYLESQQVAEKRKVIEEKKQKIALLTQYDGALDGADAQINAVDKIKTALLETLNTTLPEDTVFDNLVLTPTQIQIQGTAPGRVPVAELLHNIKALGLFDQVHVSTISGESEEEDSYSFQVSCTLKDVMEQ